jgi:lysozyme
MSHSRSIRLLVPAFLAVAASASVAGPTLAGSGMSESPSVHGATTALSASPNAPSLVSGEGYRHGIDVSHWQGRIDWEEVAAAGVDFVFVKATQGTWFTDPRYAENRAAAERYGIRVGAYHFAEPGLAPGDAVREADHFLDTAQLKPRNLVPVLDLEIDRGLGPKALRRWAKAWFDRVEERLGVKGMIYTSPSFWKYHVEDSTWLAEQGYRVLWIAHYETERPMVPAQRWDGAGWTFWQWTQCGRVDGIVGCVDRNAFNGTALWRLKIRNLIPNR